MLWHVVSFHRLTLLATLRTKHGLFRFKHHHVFSIVCRLNSVSLWQVHMWCPLRHLFQRSSNLWNEKTVSRLTRLKTHRGESLMMNPMSHWMGPLQDESQIGGQLMHCNNCFCCSNHFVCDWFEFKIVLLWLYKQLQTVQNEHCSTVSLVLIDFLVLTKLFSVNPPFLLTKSCFLLCEMLESTC